MPAILRPATKGFTHDDHVAADPRSALSPRFGAMAGGVQVQRSVMQRGDQPARRARLSASAPSQSLRGRARSVQLTPAQLMGPTLRAVTSAPGTGRAPMKARLVPRPVLKTSLLKRQPVRQVSETHRDVELSKQGTTKRGVVLLSRQISEDVKYEELEEASDQPGREVRQVERESIFTSSTASGSGSAVGSRDGGFAVQCLRAQGLQFSRRIITDAGDPGDALISRSQKEVDGLDATSPVPRGGQSSSSASTKELAPRADRVPHRSNSAEGPLEIGEQEVPLKSPHEWWRQQDRRAVGAVAARGEAAPLRAVARRPPGRGMWRGGTQQVVLRKRIDREPQAIRTEDGHFSRMEAGDDTRQGREELLRRQLQEEQNRSDSLQKQLNELVSRMERQNSSEDSAKRERTELQRQMEKTQKHGETLKSEWDGFQKQMEAMRKRELEMRQGMDEFESQMTRMSSQAAEHQKDEDDMKAGKEQLQQQFTEMKAKVEVQESRQAEVHDQLLQVSRSPALRAVRGRGQREAAVNNKRDLVVATQASEQQVKKARHDQGSLRASGEAESFGSREAVKEAKKADKQDPSSLVRPQSRAASSTTARAKSIPPLEKQAREQEAAAEDEWYEGEEEEWYEGEEEEWLEGEEEEMEGYDEIYEGEEEELVEGEEEEMCEGEEEEYVEPRDGEHLHTAGTVYEKHDHLKDGRPHGHHLLSERGEKTKRGDHDHWEMRSRTPSAERENIASKSQDALTPSVRRKRSGPKNLVEPKVESLQRVEPVQREMDTNRVAEKRHKDHVEKRRAEVRAVESVGKGASHTGHGGSQAKQNMMANSLGSARSSISKQEVLTKAKTEIAEIKSRRGATPEEVRPVAKHSGVGGDGGEERKSGKVGTAAPKRAREAEKREEQERPVRPQRQEAAEPLAVKHRQDRSPARSRRSSQNSTGELAPQVSRGHREESFSNRKPPPPPPIPHWERDRHRDQARPATGGVASSTHKRWNRSTHMDTVNM